MSKPRISDHALVRFLERTGAMDLDPLRGQIAASLERAFTAASALGVSQFVILADDLVYMIRDGIVVTIGEDDGRHAWAHHPRPSEPA